MFRIIKSIKKWWKQFTMDPVEYYLGQSTDVADLERRLRCLNHNPRV